MSAWFRLMGVVGTFAVSGCLTPTPTPQCDVAAIDAVFAAPADFQGKWFCGEGYLYLGSEVLGIYDRPITANSQRFDIALVLDARTARASVPDVPRHSSVLVYVRGQIDAQCLEEPCVPIARAIGLNFAEVRLLDQRRSQ